MKNLKYLLTVMTLLVFTVTPLTLSADHRCDAEKAYCDLGFANNTVKKGDKKSAQKLEHHSNRVGLRAGASHENHSVMSAAAEIGRPDSPYIEVDPDKVDGYGHVDDDDTKRAIRALGLESRLKLTDPLSKRLRTALRKRPAAEINSLAGALVYDDGTTDQDMFTNAFSNYFHYLEQPKRAGLFNLNNPYECEYGNHATAVTATLLQACPAVRYPVTVVGGDGKKGHFSDGPMIDDTWVPQLMKDLKRDDIRHGKLNNPVVFNASYGYDARGDFGDTLDEGGAWKSFWDEVAGSVVVQAAGNESTNLTPTDAALESDRAYETAHNMEYALNNPAYQGRLIHAIASLPDFQTGENTMAVSFSNYYRKKDTVFVHFARDHSMMAPGEYVFVPMDPFDADGDGNFHVEADQLNEWSGTSAASPMITGAILRLVNEFGITAHKAAAILLETADHVNEERKAKGEVKSMNLGAALLEGVRQEVFAEIAKPSNNYTVFSKYFLDTYFGDREGALTVAERNFIFDIADRCGNLYVMTADKKANYRRLKNWRKKYVRRGKYQSEQLYYKRAKNHVLSAYCFIEPDDVHLKTIEAQDSGEARVADFVLSYSDNTEAPDFNDLKVKGVLDTSIEIFEVEGSGSDYIVSVTVPDKFTSERVLSLHIPGKLIMGKQDNRVKFDGAKFVY